MISAVLWTISKEDLTAPAKLVAIILADMADQSGVAWPTIKTIAKRTNLSERCIRASIARLRELAVLTVEHRHRNGSRISSLFRFPAEALQHTGRAAADYDGVRHEVPEVPEIPHQVPDTPASGAADSGMRCRTLRHEVPIEPVTETVIETVREPRERTAPAAPAVPPACASPDLFASQEGKPKPEPKAETKRRPTAMRPDWRPSPDAWQFAVSQLGDRAEESLSEFIDYWISCGRPMASWDAAWRNQIRRTVGRFGLQPAATNGAGGRPMPSRFGIDADLQVIRSARQREFERGNLTEAQLRELEADDDLVLARGLKPGSKEANRLTERAKSDRMRAAMESGIDYFGLKRAGLTDQEILQTGKADEDAFAGVTIDGAAEHGPPH